MISVLSLAQDVSSRIQAEERLQYMATRLVRRWSHLERQTGGVSRDIDRGTRAISNLISYTLYSILPTLIELLLVMGVLAYKYDQVFVWITLTSIVCYVAFTVVISNWRIHIRRAVNEARS